MSANCQKYGYFAVKNWLNVLEKIVAILQFFVKFLKKNLLQLIFVVLFKQYTSLV